MPADRSNRLRVAGAGLCAAGGVVVLVAAGGRDAAAPGAVGPGPSVSVVVAARDLAAGSVVVADDVRVRSEPDSDVSRMLVHDPVEVVGRRLLVAIGSGAPLVSVEVTVVPPPDPARRTVHVVIPVADAGSATPVGSEVEVVASTGDTAATRRVAVIAVCRLVAEGRDVGAGAGAGQAPPGIRSSSGEPGLQPVTVTLDCPAAAALRVVYASDFAGHVRILAHPAGAASPTAADGLI